MKRKNGMLGATIVFAVLAAVLLYAGYRGGQGQHIAGLKMTGKMFVEIVPLLVFAFIVAGMVQVLIPREIVAGWVGAESGIKGILLGTVAGGLTPGGPYVSLPMMAGFMKAGAGIGTMVAYITAWSLWAVARLPMEVGILGWRFTAIRLACTFFMPPVAGIIAYALFKA